MVQALKVGLNPQCGVASHQMCKTDAASAGFRTGDISDADTDLAIALAEFLQVRYPSGLPLGALAGTGEVRQALRNQMREAGVRSFKAKWLMRFPEVITFDGKTVRAKHSGASGGNQEVLSSRPLSCLRRASCSDAEPAKPGLISKGIIGQGERRVTFTSLYDLLLFKPTHDTNVAVKRGQCVQRPLVDPVNNAPRKIIPNTEAWLNPALLTPIDDDIEDSLGSTEMGNPILSCLREDSDAHKSTADVNDEIQLSCGNGMRNQNEQFDDACDQGCSHICNVFDTDNVKHHDPKGHVDSDEADTASKDDDEEDEEDDSDDTSNEEGEEKKCCDEDNDSIVAKMIPAIGSLKSFDIEGISEYIKDHKVRKIIVMCGAGISTSAGIPDFRTPGTGLYDNLQRFNLPTAESIFTLGYFRRRPQPFYELCKELWPGNFEPTATHYFIRLLHEKGILLRCFTQNIDSLERQAGLPPDKVVAAHGNFDSAYAIDTEPRVEVDVKELHDAIMQGGKGWKRLRDRFGSLVKPSIVFFGEDLPERFDDCRDTDFEECQLLIVIGTSLEVFPFAELVGDVHPRTPRILMNHEPVGRTSEMSNGFQYHLPTGKSAGNLRDVFHCCDCDSGVRNLAAQLGWAEELEMLIQSKGKASVCKAPWVTNDSG